MIPVYLMGELWQGFVITVTEPMKSALTGIWAGTIALNAGKKRNE